MVMRRAGRGVAAPWYREANGNPSSERHTRGYRAVTGMFAVRRRSICVGQGGRCSTWAQGYAVMYGDSLNRTPRGRSIFWMRGDLAV